MKVLITGAGGYIGSVAAYLFLQDGFEVVAVDNFSRGFKNPLKLLQEKFGEKKLRFFSLDLQDNWATFFKKEKVIEAVVHFAAYCLVDESMKTPQKYFSNNVSASQNFFSALLENNIHTVVFSSTCAVYGEAQYVPVDEVHPINPTNPYGQSKEMVERVLQWYGKLLGLNYVILRYFNVCGASDDGLIGDSKKPSVLLVQNAVKGALGITPFFLTCPTVDTPDQTPIRDYVNVVDLNLAHLKSVKYLLKGGKSEIINLGTGEGNSVLEIVSKVEKVTGMKFDLQRTTPREGEYSKMVASIAKAKELLDWKPERSIEDSINSLILWYKHHPKGWEE